MRMVRVRKIPAVRFRSTGNEQKLPSCKAACGGGEARPHENVRLWRRCQTNVFHTILGESGEGTDELVGEPRDGMGSPPRAY
jgi:hypothetical protein